MLTYWGKKTLEKKVYIVIDDNDKVNKLESENKSLKKMQTS